MSVAVTNSEIRSRVNGNVPRIDSPPAPARAGAKVNPSLSVTHRDSNIRRLMAVAVRAGRSWWAWTNRPASLRVAWRLSTIDAKRIPLRSKAWRRAWLLSNWTDRLIMFALAFATPTGLQGPLRWLATRPLRRWGFYLIVAALTVGFTVTGKG